jgi:hypothetical protein
MSGMGANHVLTLGERHRTVRRYHVGIASVLRRCRIGDFGWLTGRTIKEVVGC